MNEIINRSSLFEFNVISFISKGRASGGTDDRCNANLSNGICPLTEHKYIFNKAQKKCELKTLGDCSGDEDLFDSENECRRACLKS